MSDWHGTAAARALGVRYPIIQGPFGGGQSSPVLTAAVSNLGGLGSYGARALNPKEIRQVLEHNGHAVEMISEARVGYVVYEDAFQVIAEPFSDTRTG